MKNNHEESILDKVTAEIRNSPVDPEVESAAAGRVWARLATAAGETKLETPAVETVKVIEGCSDFQSLIPAYIAGSLSFARRHQRFAGSTKESHPLEVRGARRK